MPQIPIIGGALVVAGILIAVLGAYQLGMARAARKWDSAEAPPRVGRGLATFVALIGLLLLSSGVGLLATLVKLPGVAPGTAVIVGVVAGLVMFVLGMYGTAKVADRVELNALIRTPARIRRLPGADAQAGNGELPKTESDSVVPPTARPGWVYRDAGGAWYLVVSAGAGYRLVSLPDFKLVPVGMVKEPVTATGSVELAVWPLSEPPGVREGEARQPAT